MQKRMLLGLFWMTCSVYAQTDYNLSGTVVDFYDEPIAVGDVVLFSKEDNTLVNYTTLNEGQFSLGASTKGSYRLQISCLGFEPWEELVELNTDISLNIKLKESTTHLNEVEVVASKPIVTQRNGNLKIDIQNPAFASIPDPMELLSKLPGIQLSPDRESLTVIGKGTPLIYIGNQRISLEEYNALSVDGISSIEIIKNPSSKYEAEGRAVLLITRKPSDTEGVKLSLSETLSFRQNFNNYNGLNGSYQKKRWTVKVNFGYNDLQTWESNSFEFRIPEPDIFSDYLVLIDKNDRIQVNAGTGLFYQINPTDYFSLNTNIRLQSDAFPIDTETVLRKGTQEDFIVTETGNDNTKDFISSNFNYNKELRPGINLFTGLQYSYFEQQLDTDISNNFNGTEFIRSQDRLQKYRLDVLAYRLDIEKTFKNKMKWEIGANISKANANVLTEIDFFEPDGMTSTDYRYAETNYASYSQLSGSIGKKINFNTGFRIENNQVNGEGQTDGVPLVDRKNTNFFPKAMFTFEIDSTKNLVFNYAKTITRPDYSRASSITSFINPFLEGAGNVNLLPTFTEELSASFQFKNSSLSASYLKKKNPMYFTIGYETNAEQAVLSLKNLEMESGFDISLTVPFTKGNWSSTNVAMLSKRHIKDRTAIVNDSKPYAYVYTDQQFKIANDLTISFGGWGLTERSEGIFNRNAMLVFNASLTKTFFDKLDCSIRWNDITKAMDFEEGYAINGVLANGAYFADGREVALSLKYTFGKIKDTDFKNKNVDDNLDRIR